MVIGRHRPRKTCARQTSCSHHLHCAIFCVVAIGFGFKSVTLSLRSDTRSAACTTRTSHDLCRGTRHISCEEALERTAAQWDQDASRSFCVHQWGQYGQAQQGYPQQEAYGSQGYVRKSVFLVAGLSVVSATPMDLQQGISDTPGMESTRLSSEQILEAKMAAFSIWIPMYAKACQRDRVSRAIMSICVCPCIVARFVGGGQ